MSVTDHSERPPASLARRITTAIVLIPLALGSVVVGGRLYAGLIAAMTIFLIFEWTRMVDGAEFSKGFYTLSATAAIASYFAAGGMPMAALLVALLGGCVATALEWPKPNPQSWAAVGAGYIVVPCIAALWLRRDVPDGAYLTALLFLCVWGADSAAFIMGKAIGGPKLVPRISPKKTWSGAIGGIVGAGLTALGLASLIGGVQVLSSLVLGLLLGVAAVLGDIAESALKRRYGMKDSGGAFPGHGGVLDRLDGFLFAVLALAGAVLLRQGFGSL